MIRFYKYLLILNLLFLILCPALSHGYEEKLAVWIRLGDLEAGVSSIEANKQCVNRILVSDHCIAKDGINLEFRVADGRALAKQAVAFAKKNNLPVLMGLGNYGNGFAHPEIITAMLNSKDKRQKHIEQILKAVHYYGYDGVDLDYENLPPSVRGELTIFVRQLAEALHKKQKVLDITVPPKFSSPGWKQTKAYDWQVLPTLVNRFNVMCYDWFVRSGPAGPVIPLGVTKKVVKFAATCPHPERFWIGHPAYGNRWVTAANKKRRGYYDGTKVWQALAEEQGETIRYEAKPVGGFEVGPFAHFSYKDKKGTHEVWFGDHRSLKATAELVSNTALGGMFIWRAGFEDEKIWQVINNRLERE